MHTMSQRIVLVIFALTVLCATAAPSAALRLEGIGVRGGLAWVFNEYEFEGVSRLDADAVTGELLGAYVQVRLKRRSALSFMIGVDHVRKGYDGTRTLPADGTGQEISVDANYLSIPVLGRLHFLEDEVVVYAVFGPSLELLISNDEDPILDGITSWSLAGNIGIGAEFELSESIDLVFEGRYNTDFTENWDGPSDLSLNSAKYQAVILTAGLKF